MKTQNNIYIHFVLEELYVLCLQRKYFLKTNWFKKKNFK